MGQCRPRRRTEITALTVEGQVRFPTCILPPVSCRASKSPRTLQGIALWPTWLTLFLLLPEKSIVMRYWIFFSFEFNWIDQARECQVPSSLLLSFSILRNKKKCRLKGWIIYCSYFPQFCNHIRSRLASTCCLLSELQIVMRDWILSPSNSIEKKKAHKVPSSLLLTFWDGKPHPTSRSLGTRTISCPMGQLRTHPSQHPLDLTNPQEVHE